MNVLVTGACGFIGRYMVSELLDAGHRVRILDNAPSTLTDVEKITGDINDAETCRSACQDMDTVIHSAGIHDAEAVARGPQRMLDVNVAGTLNILNSAAEQCVSNFVYLSSAKVYGEPSSLPSSETDLPRPLEIYALSKLASEHYCHLFCDSVGLNVGIVRPFSVYGPGQSLGSGYIGMLLESLLTGCPLRLPGEPEFKRDFVYVVDVARLCTRVATEPRPGLHVFNAGSGTTCSLRRLVALANDLFADEVSVEYKRPQSITITRTHADMSTVADELDFVPEIALTEGLRQTLDWFVRAKRDDAVFNEAKF